MAEFICEAGNNLELWRVSLDELREQDKNARIQPPEMFNRLGENIKKEGRLESLPFVVKKGDRFDIISGHHRTRAARKAELKEIIVLADNRELDKSQIRAKQIAHNAIDGYDDEETLKEMFEEINTIDDMIEAYLDPEDLDIPEPLDDVKLSDVKADFIWRYVLFAFLPKQMKEFNELCSEMPADNDLIGVCDIKIFEQFKEAARKLGLAKNIKSVGAIIAKMVEITDKYLKVYNKKNENNNDEKFILSEVFPCLIKKEDIDLINNIKKTEEKNGKDEGEDDVNINGVLFSKMLKKYTAD